MNDIVEKENSSLSLISEISFRKMLEAAGMNYYNDDIVQHFEEAAYKEANVQATKAFISETDYREILEKNMQYYVNLLKSIEKDYETYYKNISQS